MPDRIRKKCEAKSRLLVGRNMWLFMPYIFSAQDALLRFQEHDQDIKNLYEWVIDPIKKAHCELNQIEEIMSESMYSNSMHQYLCKAQVIFY